MLAAAAVLAKCSARAAAPTAPHADLPGMIAEQCPAAGTGSIPAAAAVLPEHGAGAAAPAQPQAAAQAVHHHLPAQAGFAHGYERDHPAQPAHAP